MRRGRDRCGGGEDQHGAGEDHDPQVVADLSQRGGQALPVEQHRQEQQQHNLRRQLGLAEVRHETDEHTHEHQQDRRCDRVATGQRTAHDQGDAEGHRHLQSQHAHIVTSFSATASRGRGTRVGTARSGTETAGTLHTSLAGSDPLVPVAGSDPWICSTTRHRVADRRGRHRRLLRAAPGGDRAVLRHHGVAHLARPSGGTRLGAVAAPRIRTLSSKISETLKTPRTINEPQLDERVPCATPGPSSSCPPSTRQRPWCPWWSPSCMQPRCGDAGFGGGSEPVVPPGPGRSSRTHGIGRPHCRW